MDRMTQFDAIEVAPETFAFPAYCPLPGLGMVPITSFLIRAAEPVLIDTGPTPLKQELVRQIASVIDLDDLRWIWLTHMDPDHVGALQELLDLAPRSRVVTTYLGVGKRGLYEPLPDGRAYLLNPGQELDVGDRTLLGLRPPVFDAPETVAAFDRKTRTLFAADCFGAILDRPFADADAMLSTALRDGMVTWATIDAPWLAQVDRQGFARSLAAVEQLEPAQILSSHLPPAKGMTATLLANLARARDAESFVGPDQAALEAMMAAAAG